MPPPPGSRFVRTNPNGTSLWQGANGALVDVDHTQPGMQDYAPPQQRVADASDAQGARTQDYLDRWNIGGHQPSTAAPHGRQPDMFDVNAWAPPEPTAPAAATPLPPGAEERIAQAQQLPIGPQVHAPGAPTTALPSTGSTANAHAPGAQASTRRVTFAPQTSQGAAGNDIVGGVAVMPGARGTPRRTVVVPTASSTTTQTGAELPEGYLDDLRQRSDMAASAVMHTGKNEQEELARNAETLANRNRVISGLGGLVDQSVANEQGRGARLEQARQNFNNIASQARSMMVDPDRRSGGDRVVGAIASLLGGIGSGITGEPNHAVQVIQHAIDRDVEAQRANVANRQHGVEAAQTAYQLARDQGASEREAENIHMAYEYRSAADEIERLAALTGSQEAMDEAVITAERLRQQGDQLYLRAADIGSDRTSNTQQYRAAQVGGSGSEQTVYTYRDPDTGVVRPATGQEVARVRRELGLSGEEGVAALQRLGYRLGGSSARSSSPGDQAASREYAERMSEFDLAEADLDRIERAIRENPVSTSNAGRVVPNSVLGNQVELAHADVQDYYNRINRAINGSRATDRDRDNIVAGTGPLIDRGNELTLQNIERQRRILRSSRERLRAGVLNDAVVEHNESRVNNAPVSDSTFTRGQ